MFSKILTLLAIICLPAIAQADALNELTQRAAELKLSDQPAWSKLLHYNHGSISGRLQSRIIYKDFFLAADGNTNPQAELDATIKAFLKADIIRNDQAAQCVYPARYALLKAQLDPQGQFFKDLPCERFHDWSAALNAHSLTLIFPSAFMNNPASMFGHTLLRMDQADLTEETRMLAYSVNFAATTQGENALLYAAKGVFGGYLGFFSVAPYYEKLKKYSDLESRDIWEYQLNFTPAEVDFLVKHLWELREVPFSYYYFDENCSFQLLGLFEAVRPTLEVTRHFRAHVLPVDTAKILLKEAGILKTTFYRPSISKRLKRRIAKSTEREQQAVLACTNNCDLNFPELSSEERANTLDLLYDFTELRKFKKKGSVAEEEELLFKILTERSKLSFNQQTAPVLEETTVNDPARSHGSARIQLGAGIENEKFINDYEIRPAYHSILDPQSGFEPGAGIDFMNLGLRYQDSAGLRLQKFNLLKIDSLAARDAFFKPISWQFNTGWDRHYFTNSENKLQYLTSLAFGESWKLSDKILFSALPELGFAISEHYKNDQTLYPGLNFNFLFPGDSQSARLNLKAYTDTAESSEIYYSAEMPVRFRLNEHYSFTLNSAYHDQSALSYFTFEAVLGYYW